jgi:hypothetical protein
MKKHRGAAGLCGIFGSVAFVALCSMPLSNSAAGELEAGFADPPDSAKVGTYWPWMGGYISREGITADLEAMKRVGIQWPMLFSVSFEYDAGNMAAPNQRPANYVEVVSPEWWDLVAHAAAEAKRLGLDLSMHNCPGWSAAGGPWVTPAQSMQKVVWSRKTVSGPGRIEETLDLPEIDAAWNYYREIAVLAVPQMTEGTVVSPTDVIDLSDKMDARGRLTWDVPQGGWEILRFGHTTTGKTNHPADPEARGLECDKLSAEAVEAHFDAYIGKILERADGGIKWVTIDSYEAGNQDWTPRFREEFRARRGYDPLPWLPVLAQRWIVSEDVSRRFQRDRRQTIAELYRENFYRKMTTLAHEHGLKMALEPYHGPFDTVSVAGEPDIPMAEFWVPPVSWGWDTPRPVTSGGHIYGKRVIGAEAFTADPAASRWRLDPYAIKAVGDRYFCMGINLFVLHSYAHQPWMNARPGMSMQWWGTHFTRTNTWWEQSAAWFRYLMRSQFLLQQGVVVADICQMGSLSTQAGGYEADSLDEDTLLERTRVRNGRIEIEGGMSYRLMLLPENRSMMPRVAAKVRELVAAGATVLGPKPTVSPSLEDWPQGDETVRAIGEELWGGVDGIAVTERRYGKGRVVLGKAPRDVLAAMDVLPDVLLPEGTLSQYLWTHRRDGETDIYFISNQLDEGGWVEVSFRVDGKQPELWHPDTGRIETAAVWRRSGERTIVPLRLEPCGSVFVIFRRPAGADGIVAATRDGRPVEALGNGAGDGIDAPAVRVGEGGGIVVAASEAGRYTVKTAGGRRLTATVDDVPPAVAVGGPWKLSFPEGWGAPPQVTLERLISWPEHPDAGVKYFSGTAEYATTVDVTAAALASGRRVYLDLGEVKNLAEVFVNDRNLGVLWKPPFRVDATDALRPGSNALRVQVTNLWVNRLIGDEQHPPDTEWARTQIFNYRGERTRVGGEMLRLPQWMVDGTPRPSPERVTFTTWNFYEKDSPLMPSGLLGPVALRVVNEVAATR